jgi:predicted permease
MDAWIKDLRFGLRGLVRRPVLTAAAVLSIALGVGANGAVFSLVNGILLRPPAGVRAPDELVRVYQLRKSLDFPIGLSVPDFRDVRDAIAPLVSSIAGHSIEFPGVSLAGEPPRPALGFLTVGDYFETLGVQPAVGRLYGRAEVDAGEPVAVVSHRYWQDALASDPAVVGRSLSISGRSFTVSGVAPPGFAGTEKLFAPDLWLPATSIERWAGRLEERGTTPMRVTARLHPEATIDELDRRLVALGAALADEHPSTNQNTTFHAMPDADARVEAGLGGQLEVIAGLLLLLVAFVLLIACANVANLLLVRAAARRREMAVRVAVGAGRGALVRQLLVESLLLAAVGGAGGAAIALAVAGTLARLEPPGMMPLRLDVAPDVRVYVYTAAVSLLAGLSFGLLPALRASRSDPIEGLKVSLVGAGGAAGGGRMRVGSALVVAQVALSLVLLVGGGLFVRSLRRAQAVDLGFDPSGVVALTLDVSTVGRGEEEGQVFFTEAERRVRAIAGVDGVTIASFAPMDWMADGVNVGVGRDLGEDLGDEMLVIASIVSHSYFETMRTRLVTGRGFEESDDERGRPVVVVNQALADRVWPGEPAVGKVLRIGGREGRAAEVVGVAETGKYRLYGEAPRPYLYLPIAQEYRSTATILARSSRAPGALIEEVRGEIAKLEPDLAIQNAVPFEANVQSRGLVPLQLVAGLAGAFGLIGLVLASTGLYAVIAFAVAQRVREIGVRMALGARAAEVLRAILGQGLRLAVVGVAIGLAASFAVTRVMGSFLVGISTTDPPTFATVVVVLLLVAGLASLAPALRAARVDPARTLRAD